MGGPRPHLGAALVLAGVCSVMTWLVRRHRRAALLLFIVATWGAGAAVQRLSWIRHAAAERRLFDGRDRVEIELTGRVVSAPERQTNGERAFRIDVEGRDARIALDVAAPQDADRERLDGLRRGDLILVWCTLRAPRGGPLGSADDARRRLLGDRLDAEGRVKSSRLVRRLESGGASIGRILDRLHAAAIARLDGAVDPAGRTRAILGAMVLGDRGLLDPEDVACLRDAGLVHLISISGLHTAMTVLVLLALARRAGAGAKACALASVVLLPALAALVGDGAAVWRACGLLAVTLVARATGRDALPLAALALSSAGLVIASPGLAWNIGFVLSVAATAGLVVGLSDRAAKRGPVARSLGATTGAYAATLPFVAHAFGRTAPAALVANLVAAPLCAACMAGGVLVLVVGRAGASAADHSVDALLAVSRIAANLPCGHLRVASPPPLLDALYVVVLLLYAFAGRRRAAGLAVFFLALAIHLGPLPMAPGRATVTVLDVGQGLSVLLQGGEGDVSLYDAGPAGEGRLDAGDRIVVPALAAIGCRRLDVLALSHDHDDHAGGAFAVLRDREVGELWLAQGSERDPLTQALAAEAVARGVAVRRLMRGAHLGAGSFAVDVLHPGQDDRTRPVNDRCLALRARAPEGPAILLPGDLESAGERSLLAAASPAAEALVAPHHGSDGSSTIPFVRAVAPRVVVVSVGAGNRFGHPGASALARLGSGGAAIYRTDRCGAVSLEAEARRWIVSVDAHGRAHEREHEDGEQECGDGAATPAERLTLVEQPGVASTKNEEDTEPERIGRGHPGPHALSDHPDGEAGDRRPRDDRVRPRRDREHGVTAVELPHGEEIHRRHEHTDPRRAVDRIQLE